MTRTLLVAALFLIAFAAPAAAGIASPATSTVDSFLVLCPGGDLVFHAVSRDLAGNPELDHDLDLELCDCPAIALCPLTASDPYAIVGCSARALNQDATGAASWPLRGGGGCSAATIRMMSGGVLLRALVSVASVDQDGDLAVGPADREALLAKIAAGTDDPAADLNGDHLVNAGDLAVLDAHYGHTCDSLVPARRPTWGAVKTLYR